MLNKVTNPILGLLEPIPGTKEKARRAEEKLKYSFERYENKDDIFLVDKAKDLDLDILTQSNVMVSKFITTNLSIKRGVVAGNEIGDRLTLGFQIGNSDIGQKIIVEQSYDISDDQNSSFYKECKSL